LKRIFEWKFVRCAGKSNQIKVRKYESLTPIISAIRAYGFVQDLSPLKSLRPATTFDVIPAG